MPGHETLETLVGRIRSLEIQGAKEIAVESLKWLKLFVKEKGFGKDFLEVVSALDASRPTAVVLHNCIEILKEEKNLKTIDRLLDNLATASRKIGEKGSRLIPSGATVMTHCHSGEALSIIKHSFAAGNKLSVIATETEPKHQGFKTAKDLACAGVPVTLITDSSIAFFMKDVDLVLVGSDAMRREGNVNKIGTLMMAMVAKDLKKLFYVAGDTLKLDRRKKLVIEERPLHELYHGLHSIKGAHARNPAFDVTPWGYVKRVVTEKGVLTPSNLVRLL